MKERRDRLRNWKESESGKGRESAKESGNGTETGTERGMTGGTETGENRGEKTLFSTARTKEVMLTFFSFYRLSSKLFTQLNVHFVFRKKR